MLDLTHLQNFASLHRLNHVSLGFEQLQQAAGAGPMAGAYHEQGGGLLHAVLLHQLRIVLGHELFILEKTADPC